MNARRKNVLFVLAISFLMAILRTVIVSSNLEKNSSSGDLYYLPENSVVIAFNVASVILVVAFFVTALKFGKKTIGFDDVSITSSIGSLMAAFALVGAIVSFFFAFNSSKTPPVFSANGVPQRAPVGTVNLSLLETFVIAFAVASVLKFLLVAIRNQKNKQLSSSAIAILALFPIIFSALRLLNVFIQTSAVPFASSNGYHMVSLVALLLFFLAEGKSYVSESKAFVSDFWGYAAIYLILVFAIPNLVLHSFGTFIFDESAAFSIADIGFVVYIVNKLYVSETKDPE